MPEFKGRSIAQGLPRMVDTAPKADGVEMLAHYLFMEQPIRRE